MRPALLFTVWVLLPLCTNNFALDSSSGSQSAGGHFSCAVLFRELGFPAADAAGPVGEQFALLPGVHLANAAELSTSLKDPAIRLLVLPYGSAFPEEAWASIFAFLQNNGNLLV